MVKEYKSGETVSTENNVVALGCFDGLHIAHMKIINTAASLAKENGAMCGVMLFDRLPGAMLGKNIKIITDTEMRAKLLDCVDFIYTEKFDEQFCRKSPEEFVLYLKNVLKASTVFVGFNYRFGYNASGDAELLKKLCGKYGMQAVICEEMRFDGNTVSSTSIRKLIADGDVDKANCLLGRTYTMTGYVEKGFGVGKKIGFPTANLNYENECAVPKPGVYAGFCEYAGKKYISVINVGNNPTFERTDITVECHFIDFNENIYGEKITVGFVKKIRDEMKFNNSAELSERIKKDIEICKKMHEN